CEPAERRDAGSFYRGERSAHEPNCASTGKGDLGPVPLQAVRAAEAARRLAVGVPSGGIQRSEPPAVLRTQYGGRIGGVRQSDVTGELAATDAVGAKALLLNSGDRGCSPFPANRCKVEHGIFDRSADDFDTLEVARAQPYVFGQPQSAVASLKWRRAAVRHRIKAHQAHGDRVRINAVCTCYQNLRIDAVQLHANPR